MKTKLPGLIDAHVHMREPGATHKEDWDSGTMAALAGGFTTVLAMPNTQPPVCNEHTFEMAFNAAAVKARCDYGQFLGAGIDNSQSVNKLAHRAAGLKIYLDQTYGPLKLDDLSVLMDHFAYWPKHCPIAVHAEGFHLAVAILFASMYDRSVHICHVSKRQEILLIRAAKETGIKLTCEVTPHHLFLSQDDIPNIGMGRSEVRPRLATTDDQLGLWENLAVIDIIATDHAPHTLTEKDGTNPPPGFPGLETALPVLLTAVDKGKITLDDLVVKMHTNPRRIYHLPEQPGTWIEIDTSETWKINAKETFTRCAWTPFDGWQVRGRVKKVVLREQEAFRDGTVTSVPGSGKDIRQYEFTY